MKLIVFLLQGCPADSLGAYGNEWVATPNLDGVAAEGIVFERHISECPDPHQTRELWQNRLDSLSLLPEQRWLVRAQSTAHDGSQLFYAKFGKRFDFRPSEPGSESAWPITQLLAEWPTIVAEFQATGDGILWVELDALMPPWQIPQDLFNVYTEELTTDPDELDAIYEAETTQELADDAVLEPTPPEVALLPWHDPAVGWFDETDLESWELLHRSYAAAVTRFDAEFGVMLQEVRRAKLDESADWLITSIGSFALGNHGLLGPHRPWLYREVVHRPLMLRLAGGMAGGWRVGKFTQHADTMTIIEKLQSLRPEERTPEALSTWSENLGREFAISSWRLDDAEEDAIRTADWTYIQPTSQHAEDADEPRLAVLFRLPDDLHEIDNVIARHDDVVLELCAQLDAAKLMRNPQ